jgi:hypothetical protein
MRLISSSRRAFYFPSLLMLSVLLAMLTTAAISLVTSDQRASSKLTGNDAALKAADAGLRYAQARLGEDPSWRGDGNTLVVNTPDLAVRENYGNVIGAIRATGGEWAQFRIRFNYQDDAVGNQDGLPDPVMWVDNPFVSINNVLGGAAAPVPRADGANFAVTPASQTPYEVPLGTVCVLVEGRAGPALRQLDSTNLDPPLAAGHGVTRRVVEAYLRVNSVPNTDAAAMAAGNIQVDLNTKEMTVEDDSAGVPRLRSKSEISVNGGAATNLKADNGETQSGSGNLTANYDANKVTPKTEDPNAGFYQLTWNDVKKATASDPTIAAGTYVLWQDGTFHYYDMNYDAYKAYIEGNPGDVGQVLTATDLPSSFQVDTNDPLKPKLTITGNTFVQPTGASDQFNLIPREGAKEDPDSAGGGGALTYAQQQDAVIQNVLPGLSFNYVSTPSHNVSWTVPLAGPVPGGIQEYIHPSGTGQGWAGYLRLTDNGDGTGTLVLDDRATLDLNPRLNTNPVGALQRAMTIANGNGDQAVLQVAAAIAGTTGGAAVSQGIDLGGAITDTLKPDNIKIEFKPPSGTSAILSATGDVRLGSNVTGEGGSITSGGTIRLIGAGTDLSASLTDGLNLYAKGDIVLSSLKQKSDTEYEFKDFKMKGVIYTWGNFTAKVGLENNAQVTKWGKFSLEGALVAYGGDPAGSPGNLGGGNIYIKADEAKLKFDPAYLVQINQNPPPGALSQSFYAVYR